MVPVKQFCRILTKIIIYQSKFKAMKFLNKLAAIALAMGMAACSSDEPAVDNGGNQPSDNGFYSKSH